MPRLTAAFVKAAPPGRHYDTGGHGLILRVEPTGARRFVWRGTVRGRRIELGLGSARYRKLAEARAMAFEYRRSTMDGVDPRQSRSRAPTFGEALETVIRIQAASWKSTSKNEQQWRRSMATYALPRIGDLPVDEITAADVVGVLLPIWHTKPVVAQCVRQRAGAVMRWAIAAGFRQDDPSANVLAVLPKQRKVAPKHHKALRAAAIPGALHTIRESGAWLGTRLLVEFVALTAVRVGEARMSKWEEFDRDSGTWTIPAQRSKVGREHRVPISRQASAVLDQAARLESESGFVFPSNRGGAIHRATIPQLFTRLGIAAVPHGLRSSFRSWAAEQGVRPELAERALGHQVKNPVERAYMRSDLLDQRREVMQAWADAIDPQ